MIYYLLYYNYSLPWFTRFTAIYKNIADLDNRVIYDTRLPVSRQDSFIGVEVPSIEARANDKPECQISGWSSICVPYCAVFSAQEGYVMWLINLYAKYGQTTNEKNSYSFVPMSLLKNYSVV